MSFTVEVLSDYDGYFEAEVRGAIKTKLGKNMILKHDRFVVSAGAWRSYDCHWEEDEKTLKIDFYSVARHRGVQIEEGDELFELL